MVFFGLGGASGVLDVSMNVAAVTVIRATGHALMPVFHAAFSFGALGGSVAAMIFSGFNVAMALTRLLGERVQRRWGPARVLMAGTARRAGHRRIDQAGLSRPADFHRVVAYSVWLLWLYESPAGRPPTPTG